MKREAPAHVTRALKAYDPDLSLVWAERQQCWAFEWRGRRLMSWVHADGTLAQSADQSADEALRLVRAADLSRTGPLARLKAADRARREDAERRARDCANVEAQASREADRIVDFRRRGPRPVVSFKGLPQPAAA